MNLLEFTWLTVSGLETTAPRLGFCNIAGADGYPSSRLEKGWTWQTHFRGLSKLFFSESNEKVDWGEAVQKKRKEVDLDSEVENEMKKINSFFLLHTFWLYCLLYYWRFPLLCINRDTPCQLQINCHFHFLNFPTVSFLLHIRKILVHWPFLKKIIWPQKMGCRGHFGPQAEISGWNTGLIIYTFCTGQWCWGIFVRSFCE